MFSKVSNIRYRQVTQGLFIGLFLVFLYYSSLGITLPYVGPNATNFNEYSLIAKNYNLFGFWDTRFAQVISVTKTLPRHPVYYLHHPPLISIVEAFLFRLFGYGFWVGRMAVILFSIGSFFLLYAIAQKLVDREYALLASFVFAFIPATTIFGKMIGQEPLVLFFSLLTIYLVLRYLDQRSLRYLPFLLLSVLLGTLSDWPMTYFTALLSLYLLYKKERKLAGTLLLTTTITALLFLFYIYFTMSGFSNLQTAIATRSLGELVGQPYWSARWIGIILVRLTVYFNPLFILLGVYYLITSLRKYVTTKKENRLFFVTLVLFGFGVIHILLYPEGSFGHPYWTYFLIPSVALSSAFILRKLLKRNKFVFLAVVVFAIVFMIPTQHWKIEQTKANLWRYSLAQTVDTHLSNYEAIELSIELNQASAIDPDLLNYAFSHEVKIIKSKSDIDSKNYKHFLYSCMYRCSTSYSVLAYLLDNYKSVHIANSDGEAYIFDLAIKQSSRIRAPKSKDSTATNNLAQNPHAESIFRKAYRILKDALNAPQI